MMSRPGQGSEATTRQLAQEIEAARISRQEAAELLGIKDDTLKRWLRGKPSYAPDWALDLFKLKIRGRRK